MNLIPERNTIIGAYLEYLLEEAVAEAWKAEHGANPTLDESRAYETYTNQYRRTFCEKNNVTPQAMGHLSKGNWTENTRAALACVIKELSGYDVSGDGAEAGFAQLERDARERLAAEAARSSVVPKSIGNDRAPNREGEVNDDEPGILRLQDIRSSRYFTELSSWVNGLELIKRLGLIDETLDDKGKYDPEKLRRYEAAIRHAVVHVEEQLVNDTRPGIASVMGKRIERGMKGHETWEWRYYSDSQGDPFILQYINPEMVKAEAKKMEQSGTAKGTSADMAAVAAFEEKLQPIGVAATRYYG